jgi:hypothetical protein
MRGGALQRIGRLTPDITGPEQLEEKCEFSYLSAHGLSNMESLMIVPENTFILFMGHSGFNAYINDIKKGLIINPNKDNYIQDMYNVFFKDMPTNANNELNRVIRPYPHAYVYTPGDIIHDMTLDFKSSQVEALFRMGLYTLPLPVAGDFMYNTKCLLIPFLIEYSKNPRNPGADLIRIHPDKQRVWAELGLFDYDKIANTYMTFFYNKTKLVDWFENADVFNTVMRSIISPHFMRRDDGPDDPHKNKIPTDILNPERDGRINLTGLLGNYPTEKKYRFIIITACRSPDLDPVRSLNPSYEAKNTISDPDPMRLPPETSVDRRLLRRASFSAKGPDVVCPLGPGIRPMNLTPLKDLLNTIKNIKPLLRPVADFIGYAVYRVDKPYLFIKNNDGDYIFNYVSIPTPSLFRFIDSVYIDYPLLANTPSSTKREEIVKDFFKKFISTARAIFESYGRGLFLNSRGRTTLEHTYTSVLTPGARISYTHPKTIDIMEGLSTSKMYPPENLPAPGGAAGGPARGGRRHKTRKQRKIRRCITGRRKVYRIQ